MEKELNAAIIGATGYTGGELLRILGSHPAIASITAYSSSSAGKPWTEAHPNLLGEERVFAGGDPVKIAADADVVFFCLPHGKSSSLVPSIVEEAPEALLIDLAGDFRLHDESAHRRFYGEHPCFSLNNSFTYAFPEANRDAIAGARRLACPGCFATGSLVACAGLAGTGALDGEIVSFAVTGSSGSGGSPVAGTHHPRRSANLCAYKIFKHQHEPEVGQQLASMDEGGSFRLITHSGPFVRGIFTTIHAKLAADWDANGVGAAINDFAEKNPFIHAVEGPVDLTPVLGTNNALVGYSVSGDEIILLSAIDNLVKGASGQAVQAMNIALGLSETAGLESYGFNPY